MPRVVLVVAAAMAMGDGLRTAQPAMRLHALAPRLPPPRACAADPLPPERLEHLGPPDRPAAPPVLSMSRLRSWKNFRRRARTPWVTEQPPPPAGGDGSTREPPRDPALDAGALLGAKPPYLWKRAGAKEEERELLEDITRPYWRRQTRVQYVDAWPMGDPIANPEVGGRKGLRSVQWMRGLRDDFRRKAPLYLSDWADGVRSWKKSLAAISFLYFACLAPVVAFGGAMASLTGGVMGVAEVIVSCGLSGMAYAALAGQPMTFVAPTGLTLAFTAALYRYCDWLAVPFLPMYAWVGCWTSLLMLIASMINASGLIRYCTRFTEDVFNALLAFNFLSEAIRSLSAEFTGAANKADGLLAMNCGLLTAYLLQQASAFRSTRYFTTKTRETISDFGPPVIILGVSALSLLPALRSVGTFTRLSMPGGFALSGGRPLLVNMLALPLAFRFLALLPAIFLATCERPARRLPTRRRARQCAHACADAPALTPALASPLASVLAKCARQMGSPMRSPMRSPVCSPLTLPCARAPPRAQPLLPRPEHHRAHRQLPFAQAEEGRRLPPRPGHAGSAHRAHLAHGLAVDVLRDGAVAQPRPSDDDVL